MEDISRVSDNNLQKNLDHARAAYRHAIKSLPSEENLQNGPFKQNGFVFSNWAEVYSMQVELGWAFYCRYEACLEKWLKDKNIKLTKKTSLLEFLRTNGVCVPEEKVGGLEIYRKIRNALHHDDGATFDGSGEPEFHLLPCHMERFYKLFVWVSGVV